MRRFVDDKYVFVFMDNVQIHGSRDYCQLGDLICEDHGKRIPGKNRMIGKDCFIVEQKRVIMVA